ncbi:MAG: DUF262 domain-containing protein [Acholeplasmataceae bacterium]
MNITPETKKLSALFGLQSEECYKIPEYQRNYSWKEKQIETLYTDLMEEKEGYYLGNLLLVDNNDKTYDVIDGQQRLTTISLFLLAIYENLMILEKVIPDEQKEILFATTADIKRMLFTSKYESRLTLLENDNTIWVSLLMVLKKQPVGKYGKWSFHKRYKYIKDTLIGKLDTVDEIIDLYSKIINLELLSIKVNNLTDAFNAFSSLNSKGLPLTQLDLLKVTYLKNANKYQVSKPLIKWDLLLSKFKFNGNEEHDPKLVTQFLLNNFDTFETNDKSSITKSLIITKYEKLFSSSKTYIDQLIGNADIFVNIINPTSNSKIDNKLTALTKLDSSQAYPLILFILSVNYSENLVIKILDLLINFYVRRNFCQKPKSSNIRAKMISLVRDLIEYNNDLQDDIFNRIKDVLKKISEDDNSFKHILMNEGIYDNNYDTTRYVLIDIERKYGNKFNKENPDTLDEKVGDKYRWTVEHILPQGDDMPDYWEEALKPLPEDITISDILEDNVHHLGNLTLTAYNSELSNHSFEDKKNLVQDGIAVGLQNGLFLNREVINKDKWNIEQIDSRNRILADIIVKDYNFKD